MRIVETKRKRKRQKKPRIQRLFQIFYSTQTSFPKKKKKEIINLFY